MDIDEETDVRQCTGSFLIRIHFCRNTSWQGTIQWLDGKKTNRFRSFLEMTHLINEAVNNDCGEEIEFNSWNDNIKGNADDEQI